ncbi:hypothetical protein GCM10011390_39870 [Aureimonas endophytica]|uniref:L,D-TPase catalytic domain-containing protein n=2 Tax=Aurantimonadaceae TaxID=255475 RepID=A0A917E9H4_9HYPH|nr:hypothetical protein GCM10011390_39870 [Aureimonas endophytica]
MPVISTGVGADPAAAERPAVSPMPRRAFLSGLCAVALSGCVATPKPAVAPPPPARRPPAEPTTPAAPRAVPLMYQALPNERFSVPAVDVSKVDPVFWRQEDVDYPTSERVGTLVVDTAAKYLYHVTAPGRATRYGIGVGRQGFAWSGRAHMAYKREWPRWTPPDSMVERQPELRPYSIANGGMDPGPTNPLGARAHYIHQGNVDTLYRLHGTHQPWSIGKAVSSGCIRLLNQDVIHLYDNVRNGSPIIVMEHGGAGLANA